MKKMKLLEMYKYKIQLLFHHQQDLSFLYETISPIKAEAIFVFASSLQVLYLRQTCDRGHNAYS